MSVAGIGGPGGWDEIRGLLLWIRNGIVILIVFGAIALLQLSGLPDRLGERVPSDYSGSNADMQIDTVNQKLDRLCAILTLPSPAPADDPCRMTSP